MGYELVVVVTCQHKILYQLLSILYSTTEQNVTEHVDEIRGRRFKIINRDTNNRKNLKVKCFF